MWDTCLAPHPSASPEPLPRFSPWDERGPAEVVPALDDEDYDEEPPASCINCTAPLWCDEAVCPDCGHIGADTAALFDPERLRSVLIHAKMSQPSYHRRPVRDRAAVVAYDETMLLHDELSATACPSAGAGPHPERPDRVRAVWARLQAAELAGRCVRLPCRLATDAELEAVHTRQHVAALSVLCDQLRGDREEERRVCDAEAGRTSSVAGGDKVDVSSEGVELVKVQEPVHYSRLASPAATPDDDETAVQNRKMTPDTSSTQQQAALRLPSDTYACAETARCARLSAGSAVEVALAVARGDADTGLAVVRPPGHHAESNVAQGFCFFNNAAVAARAVQRSGLARRVLILDWDVHHGNGTQEIFYDDGSVLYVSLHRHEGGAFYPGTGAADEVGVGQGAGASVNIAWPCGGLTDADYLAAFSTVILPIALEFGPDLVILSAGFDAAAGDPIGGCLLTPGLYATLAATLQAAVAPCVAILEGGYNLSAIAACTEACARALLGERQGVVPSSAKGSRAFNIPGVIHHAAMLPEERASTYMHPSSTFPSTASAAASAAAWSAIRETSNAQAPYWRCMASLAAALQSEPRSPFPSTTVGLASSPADVGAVVGRGWPTRASEELNGCGEFAYNHGHEESGSDDDEEEEAALNSSAEEEDEAGMASRLRQHVSWARKEEAALMVQTVRAPSHLTTDSELASPSSAGGQRLLSLVRPLTPALSPIRPVPTATTDVEFFCTSEVNTARSTVTRRWLDVGAVAPPAKRPALSPATDALELETVPKNVAEE